MDVSPDRRLRKIIHVDMDAFYASVEQRDDPSLRGRPVVVAWRGSRSVVCAASYEARRYGIRSAMPALRAERLCPQAVFIAPDFSRYRAASRAVREIFDRYASCVEPLSLDEAYLDVTEPRIDLPSATAIAQAIRSEIRESLQLTASAGIAPNKFLAKIASDWRKPDGQFVIKPHRVAAFLAPLPVGRLHGVGRVMEQKLTALGITTVGALRAFGRPALEAHFGSWGVRLHELSLGQDDRPVMPERPSRSISAEDTFAEDLRLDQLPTPIRTLSEKVWAAYLRSERKARTVVLKLKTAQFRVLTRSHTPTMPPDSAEELARIAIALLERVELPVAVRYRLAGVGLANLQDEIAYRQPELFDY